MENVNIFNCLGQVIINNIDNDLYTRYRQNPIVRSASDLAGRSSEEKQVEIFINFFNGLIDDTVVPAFFVHQWAILSDELYFSGERFAEIFESRHNNFLILLNYLDSKNTLWRI